MRSCGPRTPNRFARPKVRWPLVLLIGVVLLAIGTRTDGDPGLRLELAGYAVLIVGVARNAHIVGMGVLLVGASAATSSWIGMNSGMPVHGPALARVAGSGIPIVSPDGHRHLETVDDSLAILDDRIPLPAGNQVLALVRRPDHHRRRAGRHRGEPHPPAATASARSDDRS